MNWKISSNFVAFLENLGCISKGRVVKVIGRLQFVLIETDLKFLGWLF